MPTGSSASWSAENGGGAPLRQRRRPTREQPAPEAAACEGVQWPGQKYVPRGRRITMKMHRVLMVLPAVALLAAGDRPGAPPATRKLPVVDRYHGVEIVDEYRWLEDRDDPAVKEWSDAQNDYARSILDHLPGVDTIRQQVTAIRKIEIPRYDSLAYAGGELFALKSEPPKQQAFLVVMPSEDTPASARVVVDPNRIDPNGTTAVDWYVPSPDGARVAVSLSEGGSERGNLHVYETATGNEIGEVIHRVY